MLPVTTFTQRGITATVEFGNSNLGKSKPTEKGLSDLTFPEKVCIWTEWQSNAPINECRYEVVNKFIDFEQSLNTPTPKSVLDISSIPIEHSDGGRNVTLSSFPNVFPKGVKHLILNGAINSRNNVALDLSTLQSLDKITIKIDKHSLEIKVFHDALDKVLDFSNVCDSLRNLIWSCMPSCTG